MGLRVGRGNFLGLGYEALALRRAVGIRVNLVQGRGLLGR